ncbi:Hypothetical protein BN69_0404 [Methylocystis sp. SC2]|nr:Hypothetical protein BN69_0404 [Methylocystis sp. SC2]
MPHEQSLAHELQHGFTLPWRAAPRRKLGREGLDRIENGVDAALVAREGDAFRQNIGDHQQPCFGKVLYGEASVRQRLLLAVRRRFDDQRLVVAPRRARNAKADLFDDLILLQRRKAEENGDAEAVEHGESALPGVEGERRRRNEIRPFEPVGVDPLPKQQGARRQRLPADRGRRGRIYRFDHLLTLWVARAIISLTRALVLLALRDAGKKASKRQGRGRDHPYDLCRHGKLHQVQVYGLC